MTGTQGKIIKEIVNCCLILLFSRLSMAQTVSLYSLESNVMCERIKIKDRETGRIGFMDKSGKVVIPCKYNADILTKSCYFKEGYAAVSLGLDQCGWIDTLGNAVCDFCFSYCGPFINGCAMGVRYENDERKIYYMIKNSSNTLELIDSEGYKNFISNYLYYVVSNKKENQNKYVNFDLYTYNDSLIGRFCSEGNPRINANDFLSVIDGKSKKWGVINTSGNLICNYIYDDRLYYVDSCIVAMCKGKYGIIDIKCSNLVPFAYDDFFIRNGFIILCNANGWYMYDKYSKSIIEYDKESRDYGSYKERNHYGYRDLNNNINVPCIYSSEIYFNESGYALVEKEDCQMIINKKGECLIKSYKYKTNK